MSEMRPHIGICYEGAPKQLRSYVTGLGEVAITQATCTAITYLVDQYDSQEDAEDDTDATSIQAEASAGSVSSLVYDTAQDWDDDDTGFNFQFTAPAASFPTKGKWYVVEIWIDPTSGEDFLAGIWILECLPTRKD